MPGQAIPAAHSGFGQAAVGGQAGQLLYGAAPGWGGAAEKADEAWLWELFPEAFACGCLLLFAAPVVKTFDLAFDPLVLHWVGDGLKVVAALPLVFVAVGYALHRAWHRPSKIAVILSLLGSSLMLGFQAHRLAMMSMELGDRFAASDCATFPAKYALEREWQRASQFHATCKRNSADGRSLMVQECPGYALEAPQHPSWDFLKTLETTYGCAGWCKEHEPLWTLSKPQDSCSFATAFVMGVKIHPTANQVFVYCVAVLILTSAALLLAGPWLHERGVQW
mmetsp:Transcript_16084/g.50537  ORF Transcript_16084/g.50537 Transcript_16084/m.50537 type:complete len:280 (+) Transcript_16084:116-955(+)